MGAAPIAREKLYRAYLDFAESADRKRNWSVFDDIPWDKLDPSKISAKTGLCVETFCAEEMYLPDYAGAGLGMTRSIFGLAWFEARWTFEESKHALALREYLKRSGLRDAAELDRFEESTLSQQWKLPFAKRREMACYGALQETATHLAYRAQKQLAERENNPVLEAIYFLLGRDEAAHAGFYCNLVEFELQEDRAGTLTDLANVISKFQMPGVGLIPNYQQRLIDGGGGISPRTFMESGLLPILRRLATTWAELKRARPEERAPRARSSTLIV